MPKLPARPLGHSERVNWDPKNAAPSFYETQIHVIPRFKTVYGHVFVVKIEAELIEFGGVTALCASWANSVCVSEKSDLGAPADSVADDSGAELPV